MVSNKTTESRETDRRKLLATFIYDMAKLMFGSVAIGGLSPLLINGDLKITHIVCVVFGTLCGISCAFCANYVMKFK